MPTVAIIGPVPLCRGTSRGIGLELVRQYAEADWVVIATVRNFEAPGVIADFSGDITLYSLDVRDTDSITELGIDLAGETIDVLIHNAGIKDGHSRDELMLVNADAPIQVTEVLLDNVARSEFGRVVLMSSQMGVRGEQTGSLGSYGDSKEALNDAFRDNEPAWAEQGVTAVLMHPGWVQTDMGGANASITVSESAAGIRAVVDSLSVASHGKFLTWRGDEHPW